MEKLIYHIAITFDNFIADLNAVADNSIFLSEGDHVTEFIPDIQQYDAGLLGEKPMKTPFNSVLSRVSLALIS